MEMSETCTIAISFQTSHGYDSLWQWRNVVSREILRVLCFIDMKSSWLLETR